MRWLSILSGLGLLAVIAFMAGMWTTHKYWLPWRKVDELLPFVRSYRDTGLFLPQYSYHYRSASASDERHVVHDPDRASDGNLFLARMDVQRGFMVAELLDRDGAVLHGWEIPYSRYFGGSDDFPGHAVEPLPDGSVLANFDSGHGLLRIDTCSDAIWIRDDMAYHHSLHPDEKGGWWTWGSVQEADGQDQRLIRFDAEDGHTLEEIDLIDDVVGLSDAQHLAMRIPEDYVFNRDPSASGQHDIFHPNDAEPLPAAMAEHFPMFEPGDLLVSLRNLDMLAVIDRDSYTMKWWSYGPYHNQHDPDFEPDGTISVFSNNNNLERSSIIKIDPATNRAWDVYWGGALDFDSFIMGKQQLLPNGNRLVVSTMEGRVIEVAPNGDILREFGNILTPVYSAVVTSAKLLPPDFFDNIPTCDKR